MLILLVLSLVQAEHRSEPACRALNGQLPACANSLQIILDSSYFPNLETVEQSIDTIRNGLMPLYKDGTQTNYSFSLYGIRDTSGFSCLGYVTVPEDSQAEICIALQQIESITVTRGVMASNSLQNIVDDVLGCTKHLDRAILFTYNARQDEIENSAWFARQVSTVVVNLGNGDYSSWIAEGATVICPNSVDLTLAIATACYKSQSVCSTPEPNTATPPQPTFPPNADSLCDCNISQSWNDIVIVVDSSDAMGQTHYIELENFVKSALHSASVGQDLRYNTRIGVITYASSAHIVANLTKYNSLDEFFADEWPYEPTADTNIYDAVNKARDLLAGSGHRPKSRPVIILGASTYRESPHYSFPQNVTFTFKRNFGVVIVVAFGDLHGQSATVLRDLASPGFFINATQGVNPKFQDLTTLLCNANCFCPGQQTNGYYPVEKTGESWPSQGCYWNSVLSSLQQFVPNVCKHLSDAPGIPFMPKNAAQQLAILINAPYNLTRPAYLIGLTKAANNNWIWNDGTPYTGPSIPGNGACAVVKQGSGLSAVISAVDCGDGFYYGCQTMPCTTSNECL